MPDNSEKILKKINPVKIILPMLIGLGVVGYFMYNEFKDKEIPSIDFTYYTILFLFISLLMMVIRDLGYMIRLRVLSEKELTWRKILRIVFLWEFASAVTPSAVGGTGVAIFFVHKEGLNIGRSSAIVMVTSFLDELYFIIMVPLLFFLMGGLDLFVIVEDAGDSFFSNDFFYFTLIGYGLKFLFTCFVVYGLFFNSRGLKWLLIRFFRVSFLRRWRYGAGQTGTDLIEASNTFKKQSFSFWIKAFAATFFSWTARYWVVNLLLLALIFGVPDDIAKEFYTYDEHMVIFSRQLFMWVILILMPTPGGSGFAEIFFGRYIGQFIWLDGMKAAVSLLWRLITYYPYLIIGVFLVPRWVKRVYGEEND